jgi:hypothetical protein
MILRNSLTITLSILVHRHVIRAMQRKRAEWKNTSRRVVRSSGSLQAHIYRTFEALACRKKVSAAWVLRDAAEKYAADKWPLLGRTTL